MEKTNQFEKELNNEVKPKEILEYFEDKYSTENIVSPKTIKRWLDNLGIKCIQPQPKANRNIRYRKKDVLKLEKNKREELLKIQYQDTFLYEKEKIARDNRKKQQEYYNVISSMTKEEIEDDDRMFFYDRAAEQMIQQDKLEMCFNKLFPDITFNKVELARSLYNVQAEGSSDEEIGDLNIYIDRKLYREKKK